MIWINSDGLTWNKQSLLSRLGLRVRASVIYFGSFSYQPSYNIMRSKLHFEFVRLTHILLLDENNNKTKKRNQNDFSTHQRMRKRKHWKCRPRKMKFIDWKSWSKNAIEWKERQQIGKKKTWKRRGNHSKCHRTKNAFHLRRRLAV